MGKYDSLFVLLSDYVNCSTAVLSGAVPTGVAQQHTRVLQQQLPSRPPPAHAKRLPSILRVPNGTGSRVQARPVLVLKSNLIAMKNR